MLKKILSVISVILLALVFMAFMTVGAIFLGRSRMGEPQAAGFAPTPLFGDTDCEISGCTYVQNHEIVELFDGLVQCRLFGNEGWYRTRSCIIQNMIEKNCTFHPCTAPQQ